MMGILALMLVFIQPASALEGTYIYRGDMNAPYHSVSFSPIKSLTHLAQGTDFLKYKADQTVVLDGRTYTSAIYLEGAEDVKISVGDAAGNDYHQFVLVANKGIKEIRPLVKTGDDGTRNALASVKVEN